MTAKLRVELENATGKGFDEITKDLAKMGKTGKDAEKAMDELNKELSSRSAADATKAAKELADQYDGTTAALSSAHSAAISTRKSLQDLSDVAQREAANVGKAADFHKDLEAALNERKLRAYREQIDKLADEMTGLGKATKEATQAASQVGTDPPGGGWLAVASKAHVAALAIKGVWEGAKKVGEFVSYMSDQGVPAFQHLTKAGTSAAKELLTAFSKKEFEDLGATIALGINKLAVPAMKGLISTVGALSWAVTAATDRLLKLVGTDARKLRQELEDAGKAAAGLGKFKQDMNERNDRGIEGIRLIMEAQRARQLAEAAARREELKTVAEVEKELEAAHSRAAERAVEMRTNDKNKYEIAKQRLGEELIAIQQLETKRTQIIKERLDKQKEREKAVADAQAATEKKHAEEELKHIETLLKSATQSADDIRELEDRRFKLVKENKERERKLAIEQGTLEQKLFEEDMARIEARKKKEREAALAGIENERKLYLAREHRRDLERQAEQEKVDKFKEFLQGGSGGDSFGFGGNSGNTQFTFAPQFTGGGGGGGGCCCPCPGGGMGGGGHPMPMGGGMPPMPMQPQMPFYPPMMPPMWQGPNIPMPQGWHGQTPWPGGGPKPRPSPMGLLTGGITPRNVWDQTVKNAQDEAERNRIAEGQATGKLDQNGNPIDYKKEEEREKSKYVRNKIAQGFQALGIDIGPQQSLGDEQKPRAGWNDVPTEFNTPFTPLDGVDWRGENVRDQSGRNAIKNEHGGLIPVDSEEGQKILRAQKLAQDKKLKAAAEARKQAEGDPYKKIQELTKQEEEQQRKKEAAEQTRKQGETDKSANLPDLKKKEEEESKKLADIQKAKNEELKKVREFEEKRRQESSDRTKAAQKKQEQDKLEAKEKTGDQIDEENDMNAIWDVSERGGTREDLDENVDWRMRQRNLKAARLQNKADAKAKKLRDDQRKFSPDYGPETPKQRADARKLAQARARAATKKTKAQTKTKKLQQGKRGQITGVETTRAYHDVVQQQVENLKSQGRLDQTQTQAIEQLTQGFRESSMSNAEMQAKLDELLQVISEIRGARPPKGRRQAGR